MDNEDSAVKALILQFLEWMRERPRSYEEVTNAWRTSCPRLQVWEEAVSQGLVRRRNHQSLRSAMVVITDAGQHLLKTAEVAARLSTSIDQSRKAFAIPGHRRDLYPGRRKDPGNLRRGQKHGTREQ
jgi:hypothetical protein